MNTRQFYINGRWVEPVSQKTISVRNPATGDVVSHLSCANQHDVQNAVEAAKVAFASYSKTLVQERVELISDINDALIRRNDEIAAAISLEMGAPKSLSIEDQAPSGPQHFGEILEVLKHFSFSSQTERGSIVRREPIGVCALISPWNWPMNQIATKVAPALAAGCTMILKPSEIAPLSALILADIMDEVGVPAGVFNLINGTGADIGDRLTSHPDIDMVSFTGSTRAGVAITHSAAPTIKRVSLELGGKSAGIIASEIDIDEVAGQIVSASMGNTGQSCNALTRVLIPENLYADYSQSIANKVSALTVDMPENDPNLGPVANSAQFEKVQHYINVSIEQGATLLAGGPGKPAGLEQGNFVKPTVFGDVTQAMDIANEEVFGPVLSLMSYHDIDEAIRIANDSQYGLSGYVWSATQGDAEEVAFQMRTGMVHINGAGLDSGAPFGGFKQSGNGREWGEYGLDEFLEFKSVYRPQPE